MGGMGGAVIHVTQAIINRILEMRLLISGIEYEKRLQFDALPRSTWKESCHADGKRD